jgi:hypothetical protein
MIEDASAHKPDGTVPSEFRDIFVSHRSVNKDFVRKLSSAIEKEKFRERNLLTWVDEAEIRPGQSIVRMINEGLEKSRFIGLIMTPEYFQSDSGWTDAEWHAALFTDPDNRRGGILPLLAADCPYIPVLLRHLDLIDFRGNKFQEGLQLLLRILRDEPLPRPSTYNGQLITPSGRINRATLVAERAIPEGDPDVVWENLYCNLLPVEHLPKYIYRAPIAERLYGKKKDGTKATPSKAELRNIIRAAQEEAKIERPFMPAFRIHEGMIVTFHDLESPDGPLASVIDEEEDVDVIPTSEFIGNEDDRKLLVSLLHMALNRHASRVGLVIDETKSRRFYFPPKDGGPNIISWVPLRKRSRRTVAKACTTKDGEVRFWRHLGAYLTLMFLGNKFYLRVTPTWVVTDDGSRVRGGLDVGRIIIKWTGPERNLHVLYHVRFWTMILRRGPGPIAVRAGDQSMEISTRPAFIELAYGIGWDQRDLLRLLDQEAQLIAENEDERADQASEVDLEELASREEEKDVLDKEEPEQEYEKEEEE